MSAILDTTAYVVEHSAHVRIDTAKVAKFAHTFDHTTMEHWLKNTPFSVDTLSPVEKLNFLIAYHAMSFSYWGTPKWTVNYAGKEYDGAMGLLVAFKRAIEEGMPILDPAYRAQISYDDFLKILRGNTQIPLFEERLDAIRETGTALINTYDSNPLILVQSAQRDVHKLYTRIARDFPTFADTAVYRGQEILFYKRAQLLISDISHLFERQGPGEFINAEQITACADYKLPQVLRKHGILRYSEALAHAIDSHVPLPHQSEQEIEVRANTIWAVEHIRRHVHQKYPHVTATDINDCLWLTSQTKHPEDKPYHLTRTMAY